MGEENTPEVSHQDLLRMAADIVAIYVSRNKIDSSKIPETINDVFEALRELTDGAAENRPDAQKPAVSIRRSVTAEYIVCLEDGRKMKMLKRHLRAFYNMSPDEYRRRWNLPSDYPMVAPNYAKRRSEFAKSIGLGRVNA